MASANEAIGLATPRQGGERLSNGGPEKVDPHVVNHIPAEGQRVMYALALQIKCLYCSNPLGARRATVVPQAVGGGCVLAGRRICAAGCTEIGFRES